jgi:hypothetical protein
MTIFFYKVAPVWGALPDSSAISSLIYSGSPLRFFYVKQLGRLVIELWCDLQRLPMENFLYVKQVD